MKPFLAVSPGDHWLDGSSDDDNIGRLRDALGKLNVLADDFQKLEQSADVLIQRITNLISIDEGYRSRDQNASLSRLSWITVSGKLQPKEISDINQFIFLPLVFVAVSKLCYPFKWMLIMYQTEHFWNEYRFVER